MTFGAGGTIGQVLNKFGEQKMYPSEGLGYSIVCLVVLVVIFFICRSLILWYWKLDKIEEHLSAIRRALENKN